MTVLVAPAKHIVAMATVIMLLTSCGGGLSTPPTSTTALTSNPTRVARLLGCPCLYATIPYSHTYPQGAITVFPLGKFGDTTPIQLIAGASTSLSTPSDIAVDASRNMYVADFGDNTITVYAAGATGNVAPTQTIVGSNTGLASPFGIAIDPVNKDIYVANKFGGGSGSGSITIYPPGANGNVAPIGTIAGSSTQLNEPLSLAIDPSGNIYVPNLLPLGAGSVTVYAAGSTGNVAPIATISGSNTGLNGPYQVALDSSLNVYAANFWPPFSITVYAAGANGNVAPIRTVTGAATLLVAPDGVAVDSRKRLYAANYDGNSIGVFAPGANGNVAPTHLIKGRRTAVKCPSGLTIY